MTNHNNEAFQPTPEWPLQAGYKERLHNRLQEWAQAVLPALEGDEQREDKEAFLEHLVRSVIRGDSQTAYLLKGLDCAARESYRSWYTEELGYVSQDQMAEPRRRYFETLYAIYRLDAPHP